MASAVLFTNACDSSTGPISLAISRSSGSSPVTENSLTMTGSSTVEYGTMHETVLIVQVTAKNENSGPVAFTIPSCGDTVNFWLALRTVTATPPIWQKPYSPCSVNSGVPMTLQPGDSVVLSGRYNMSAVKIPAGIYDIQANVAVVSTSLPLPIIGAGQIIVSGP
jgi:hypothetical protein